MKAIADNIQAMFSENGKMNITLSLVKKQDISKLKSVIENKKMLSVEIKQHRKRRSLDANAYAWVLMSKMADVLRTSKEEIYLQMLKRYGQREKELISVIAEGLETIKRATDNHCIEVGESELNGKVFKHLAILIGSSKYDSREMAILIDGIISECKELGINTITENEKAEMLSKWGVQ